MHFCDKQVANISKMVLPHGAKIKIKLLKPLPKTLNNSGNTIANILELSW